MPERPTQEAQWKFNQAIMQIDTGGGSTQVTGIALGLQSIAEGLGQLAIGLRATYVLLEDVQRLLHSAQQQGPIRSPRQVP
jgi:hypothetical protein